MTFTASSNILLDNSNFLTSSSLDDSKTVFTCNRNEGFTRDKTHRAMKNNFCFHDLAGWDFTGISRGEIQFEWKTLIEYKNICENLSCFFSAVDFVRTLKPSTLQKMNSLIFIFYGLWQNFSKNTIFRSSSQWKKNVKWEVFYIDSCPTKSCSTIHL